MLIEDDIAGIRRGRDQVTLDRLNDLEAGFPTRDRCLKTDSGHSSSSPLGIAKTRGVRHGTSMRSDTVQLTLVQP